MLTVHGRVQHRGQRLQHLTYLHVVGQARFPVDDLQRVIQKMGVDLALQSHDLRVPQGQLLLIDALELIFQLVAHGVEAVAQIGELLAAQPPGVHLNAEFTLLDVRRSPAQRDDGPVYLAVQKRDDRSHQRQQRGQQRGQQQSRAAQLGAHGRGVGVDNVFQRTAGHYVFTAPDGVAALRGRAALAARTDVPAQLSRIPHAARNGILRVAQPDRSVRHPDDTAHTVEQRVGVQLHHQHAVGAVVGVQQVAHHIQAAVRRKETDAGAQRFAADQYFVPHMLLIFAYGGIRGVGGIDGRCWIVHQRDDGIAEFVVVAVLLGEKGLHLVVKRDVIARFRVGCPGIAHGGDITGLTAGGDHGIQVAPGDGRGALCAAHHIAAVLPRHAVQNIYTAQRDDEHNGQHPAQQDNAQHPLPQAELPPVFHFLPFHASASFFPARFANIRASCPLL